MDDIPTLTRQRELTRDHSIDTATALLIRCLTGIPEIRLTQAMFVSELEASVASQAPRAASSRPQ